MRKGTTGIGYTFEKMIGKQDENLPIADYENIEIKVKKRYSKGKIGLFCANPDNEVYAIKRIYNTYGLINPKKKFYKTFTIELNSKEYIKKGKYLFKLRVDYKEKIIRMQIFDLNRNLIEENISWSFKLIYEKIYYKIKNLAIIKADVKEDNLEKYYNYYHIDFYEIKNYRRIINLIDDGIVKISFNISIYMDEKRFGKIYNHGTSFNIHIFDIQELYIKKDFKKNN